MRTELPAQQIADYQDNGFTIVEDFLTPDELEEWRAAVDETVTERGLYRPPKERAGENATYYTRVFIQSLNMWQESDRIKDLVLDPRIGRMCCELEGIDGIRVWHDQTLQKMPWANPTSWHMDCPNWSFHHRSAISIWIALDHVTVQNGCMYYLPGSHRVAEWERKGGFSPDVGAMFDEYPELRSVDPVPAVMKAGDAGFHNGLTAHGAGPNMTPYPRRGMTCAYMPDGATFNGIQNILGEEYMAGLSVGDVLDDDEQTPLVWSKSA